MGQTGCPWSGVGQREAGLGQVVSRDESAEPDLPPLWEVQAFSMGQRTCPVIGTTVEVTVRFKPF